MDIFCEFYLGRETIVLAAERGLMCREATCVPEDSGNKFFHSGLISICLAIIARNL